MLKKRLYRDLERYIEQNLILTDRMPVPMTAPMPKAAVPGLFQKYSAPAAPSMPDVDSALQADYEAATDVSLSDRLADVDESFSECLMRLIDEKGMTDAECYKKAFIDRKLFSKIRSNRLYQPSKATAIAFSIALELDLKDTRDFLGKAGFTLSHSSKADIIIEYFILCKRYSITDINEALYEFDQPLL